MEIQIISTACIKPSSPTPLHLRSHKLCLLDQYHQHYYAPSYLYYPSNLPEASDVDVIVSARLQLLKQSLSETLVRYYPLAGKMTDDYSVDCSDEGIYFVEARANKTTLSDFLDNPDINLIIKFFPVAENEQFFGPIAGAHVAKVQVTSFSCGGLVICACISHMSGDGTTFRSFIKSWAATALGSAQPSCPVYNASSLFPQNGAFPRESTQLARSIRYFENDRSVTRRFVFSAKAIADLKAKASSSTVQRPTRVEVVSAILSKCIMAAIKTKTGTHVPTLLSHAVNLRGKARPPLSEHLAGNIFRESNALCRDDDDDDGEPSDLSGLVCKIREAIKKLDAETVKSLEGSGGFDNFLKALKDEDEEYGDVKERFNFTSYCNFGFYEIDFGWGKPVWVSASALGGPLSPLIVLMDTKLGDGVEAWVYLLEDYMNLLQDNKELLAFASLDPSPLNGLRLEESKS